MPPATPQPTPAAIVAPKLPPRSIIFTRAFATEHECYPADKVYELPAEEAAMYVRAGAAKYASRPQQQRETFAAADTAGDDQANSDQDNAPDVEATASKLKRPR